MEGREKKGGGYAHRGNLPLGTKVSEPGVGEKNRRLSEAKRKGKVVRVRRWRKFRPY